MKCRNEITIDADREIVWQIFDNEDNLPAWQPTLKSFTHKSGIRGQPGRVAELVYADNGREIVITETLTEKRAPDFMASTCESSRSKTIVVHHFESVDTSKTRWIMYANYQFKGLFRLLGFSFLKSIDARSSDRMQRFRLFVETEQAQQEL